MRKLVLFIALSLSAQESPKPQTLEKSAVQPPKIIATPQLKQTEELQAETASLKKTVADQKSKIDDLEKQVRSLDARQKVAWANFNRCVEDSVALLAAQPKQ